MKPETMSHMEKLRGRKFSEDEKRCLYHVGNALNLRDDDAVWSLLAAMEYQRIYYEVLPGRIAKASEEILSRISDVADKEVSAAQAKLTESVVEQAQSLSTRIQYRTLLPLALVFLLCLLAYGAFLMWAGFRMGAGEAVPIAAWLRMPSGYLMGGLSGVCAFFCAGVAARHFANSEKEWYWYSAAACVLFFVSVLLVLSVFAYYR